jgi:Rrf2 family transcriptional regulator, cysteine metabolism repressor
MRVSTRGRYAVRAVLDLAMNFNEEPVPLAEISKRQGISLFYLEQLFNKMKKSGLVISKKGAGGGYVLSRSPRDITVGDIVRSVEGPIAPVRCAAEGKLAQCSRIEICPTTGLWKQLGDKIENFLDSITIRELCEEAAACAKAENGAAASKLTV